MKKTAIIVLTLVMMMSIGIGSASAAGSTKASASTSGSSSNSLKAGTIGLNFDVLNSDPVFMLTGKYFIMNDLAVLAGFGFGVKGGDSNGTDIAILGGIRKYLKTEDFAPFVGGKVFYSSTQDSAQKDLGIGAEAGAEYFLGKQFSIEGSIGFGYTSRKTSAPLANFKDTTIGTQRSGLSVNYYF
jgi:hypothetical protein